MYLNTPLYLDHLLARSTFGIFFIILSLYTLKWQRYPQAVLADLRHPIRLSFIPAVSIGRI